MFLRLQFPAISSVKLANSSRTVANIAFSTKAAVAPAKPIPEEPKPLKAKRLKPRLSRIDYSKKTRKFNKKPVNPRINTAIGTPHSAIPRAPHRNYSPRQKIPQKLKDYYKLRLTEALKRRQQEQAQSIDSASSAVKVENSRVKEIKTAIVDSPLSQPQKPENILKGLPREIQRPTIQYPYFVERSKFNCLPVYTDVRNGRTRLETIVRRIEGDAQALANDIFRDLFPNEQRNKIAVRKTSGQVVIKGIHDREVQLWLYKKGF